jgi:O-antigen biosynthesis protein
VVTISIFTATHNPQYLAETYNSVKDQDLFEWVILANGIPLDSIPAVLRADPRVKVHSLPTIGENYVGALKARACRLCRGDVLLELDHDDLLMPDAIAEVKTAFADSRIGFVYSNAANFRGDFEPAGRFADGHGWQYRPVEYRGHKLEEHVAFPATPASLYRVWYAPNHLRAWRRSVYEQIGAHDPKMRVLDDQDLICRTYLATEFRHVDRCLYPYRIDGNNTWLKHNGKIQQNTVRIGDEYLRRLAARWPELNGLLKLNLGGRFNRQAGYLNVDLRDADLCCDLRETWPFADNSVGVILADDVLEHLPDKLQVIKEVYRVLAPGGYFLSRTPSTDGRGAFQDPTHVAFYNENSFLYYSDSRWARYIDTPVKFQSLRLFTTPPNEQRVSWVVWDAAAMKDGWRGPGAVLI